LAETSLAAEGLKRALELFLEILEHRCIEILSASADCTSGIELSFSESENAWFRLEIWRFWTWFQEHEGEIFRFEENRESVFGALVAQLRRVDPDLVFEFSSVCDDRREFIV